MTVVRTVFVPLAAGALLALAGCGNGPPDAGTGGGGGGAANANDPGQKVSGQTAATTVQEVDALKFNPASASVKSGAVVEWDNSGAVAHNVTFDSFSGISSDTMNGGDKYQVKFTKPGTYQYHCTFHAGMQGTLTVG